MTDKIPIKITQGTFLAILAFLIGILGWFIRGWMNDVDKKLITALEARETVIELKTLIPELRSDMKEVKKLMYSHILKDNK